MDFTNYRPAPEVLEHIGQIDFVAVVGPTAAGKTTLIKAATARGSDLHMLVSGVSRPARAEERNGVDFHFGDKAAMAQRAASATYVTVVSGVSGDLYTTAPEDYPADKTVLMAVLADAIPAFRALPYRSFRTIFIVPPDYATWQQRLKQHGFDAAQLERRMQEAARSLEFALNDASTHFVLNAVLSTATKDLIALTGKRPLTARQRARESRGREVAYNLLQSVRRRLLANT